MSKDQTQLIDFIGGHVGYGIHENLQEKITYVSFLRDPKKRLISDYKEHCKEGRHFYDELKTHNFSFNRYLELLENNAMDNLLTRQLRGPFNFYLMNRTSITPKDMETALQNANHITFFDIDDFDGALRYFYRNHAWKNIQYKIKNKSDTTIEMFDYNEVLFNRVIENDVQLYNQIKSFVPKNFSLFEKIKIQLKI